MRIFFFARLIAVENTIRTLRTKKDVEKDLKTKKFRLGLHIVIHLHVHDGTKNVSIVRSSRKITVML